MKHNIMVINFICSLNEENRTTVYKALAENRKFTDLEWEQIQNNLALYRESILSNDTIDLLMEYLNPQEKDKLIKSLRENNNGNNYKNHIYTFEDILNLDSSKVRPIINSFPIQEIVNACIGTSPENREYISQLVNDSNFKTLLLTHDSIPITEIERCQRKIKEKINHVFNK